MIEQILERLIRARRQAGLSQGQVAVLTEHKHRSSISYLESGEHELSVVMLLKLAEIYGVNIVWVMTGTNPDFDPAVALELTSSGHIAPLDSDKILDLLESTGKREDTDHA